MSVLVCFFVAMLKHRPQQFGGGKFIWHLSCSPSSREEAEEGTEGICLDVGPEAKTKVCC